MYQCKKFEITFYILSIPYFCGIDNIPEMVLKPLPLPLYINLFFKTICLNNYSNSLTTVWIVPKTEGPELSKYICLTKPRQNI